MDPSTNEEFNNFMYRVTEVSAIIQKLGSKDKKVQEIGTLEADRYLNDDGRTFMATIDEDNVKLTLKNDRTVINKAGFLQETMDQETMSQDAFMKHVEKDAEERFQNRKVREEKASTFKTQALKAFRRGEFERAITCYTKAIEQIKDSPSLYTNRCLAYMNLKFYDKAMGDAKQALYLNENNLKAGLLLAKIHFLKGNSKEFDQITDEIREKHSDRAIFIEEYLNGLEKPPE